MFNIYLLFIRYFVRTILLYYQFLYYQFFYNECQNSLKSKKRVRLLFTFQFQNPIFINFFIIKKIENPNS
jgi:hypothetical protein